MSADATRRVAAMHRAIRAARAPFVVDVHPAYTSVLVEFDVLRVDHARVERFLTRLEIVLDDVVAPRTVLVPVTYDGPDLGVVAAHAGVSVDDVIRAHSGAAYTVAFLGFLPGFAYLLGLPPALATPRRDVARTRVPAGSVAIGGAQTGVYPVEGPGGWQLLGHTSMAIAPGWVQPGDIVRFVPVVPVVPVAPPPKAP